MVPFICVGFIKRLVYISLYVHGAKKKYLVGFMKICLVLPFNFLESRSERLYNDESSLGTGMMPRLPCIDSGKGDGNKISWSS